jgi:methyltransferase
MRLSRFLGLCAAVAAERLLELGWSRRHEQGLYARGGRRVQEGRFLLPAMVALHAGTLISAPLEATFTTRPAPRSLQKAAAATLALASLLRFWTLASLGQSWSVRIIGFARRKRVVTSGPYRYVRHPNYLAVILELLALPLSGGAWVTAVAASTLNAVLLSHRIANEERVLFRDPVYRAHFARLPRFLIGT